MSKDLLLPRLIAPMSLDDFFTDHWGERHLVCHGSLDRFADLANLPELANAASLIRAHDQGETAAWGKRRIPTSRSVSGDKALEAYGSGYSLYLMNLERSIGALRQFTRALEKDLGIAPHSVRCEGFASKGGAGLPPHFDFDDNFNIQLTGSKQWRIRKNDQHDNPHLSYFMGKPVSHFMRSYSTGELPKTMPEDAHTEVTAPGSVVFLPRGTWHTTEAHEETLAIAFSLKPQRWFEVMREVVERRLILDADLRSFSYGRYMFPLHPVDCRAELTLALTRLKERVAKLSVDDVLAEIMGPETEFRPPLFQHAKSVQLRFQRDLQGDSLSPGILRVEGVGEEAFDVEIASPLCSLMQWVITQRGSFSPSKFRSSDLKLWAVVEALHELAALDILEVCTEVAAQPRLDSL